MGKRRKRKRTGSFLYEHTTRRVVLSLDTFKVAAPDNSNHDWEDSDPTILGFLVTYIKRTEYWFGIHEGDILPLLEGLTMLKNTRIVT